MKELEKFPPLLKQYEKDLQKKSEELNTLWDLNKNI